MRLKKWFVFMVLLPLILGGAFYYFFCPDVYFVSLIDKVTGLNVHVPLLISRNPFVKILRSYLLDYIWAFAFANMLFLLRLCEKKSRFFILVIPVGVGAVLEILQGMGYITGTFDVIDIFVEVAGAALAYIIILLKNGGYNEKD